jgi:hypothetical protein
LGVPGDLLKKKAPNTKHRKKQVRKVLKQERSEVTIQTMTVSLPDPKSYPRAEPVKVMPAARLCKHCGKWNPKCWTQDMCVYCFRDLEKEG